MNELLFMKELDSLMHVLRTDSGTWPDRYFLSIVSPRTYSSLPSCEDRTLAVGGCQARHLRSTAILEHDAWPLIPCGQARRSVRQT